MVTRGPEGLADFEPLTLAAHNWLIVAAAPTGKYRRIARLEIQEPTRRQPGRLLVQTVACWGSDGCRLPICPDIRSL